MPVTTWPDNRGWTEVVNDEDEHDDDDDDDRLLDYDDSGLSGE